MSESVKSPLPAVIDDLWEQRSGLSPEDTAARAEVVAAVDEIDAGNARVAFVDPATGEVVVDERAKHAVCPANCGRTPRVRLTRPRRGPAGWR